MTRIVEQSRESPAPVVLDAFVSYSRRDAARVMEIVEAARARGRTLWVDTDDIPPGAPWRTELGTAIEAANAVVCCISPAWLASQECQNEYRRAVELGKRLIPVQLSAVEQRPQPISALHWLTALNGESPEAVATAVLAAADVDPDGVREHTHWLARALRWDARERDRSLLLRGRDLRAAEDWLARTGTKPSPVPLQTELVAASRTAERRRLRTTIAVTATTLVVTLLLGLLAVVQWREAVRQRDQAQSRALAAAALAQLDVDPERSLLLARAALATARTDQAVGALRTALERSRVRVRVPAHTQAVSGVAWSPDGATVVSAGRDGDVTAWDASTGASRGALALGPAAVGTLVAARTAPTGIAATEDGRLVLWALDRSGTIGVRAEPAPSGVTAATISADGRVVAAGTQDGTVRLWDAGGQERGSVRWTAARVRSIALSADGATLLVGGSDGIALVGPATSTDSVRYVRHSFAVDTTQLSTDGTVMLTASSDGTATVRRVADGTELMSSGSVLAAALDPAGGRLVVAHLDGTVELVGAAGAPTTLRVRGPRTGVVGFSPDGSLVHVGGYDGVLSVWRAVDGRPVVDLPGGPESALRASVTADGTRLVSGDGGGGVRVWALPDRPLVLPLTTIPGWAGTPRGSSVEFDPAGARVLAAARGGLVRVFDAGSAAELPVGTACTAPPTGLGCLGLAAGIGYGAGVVQARYSPDGSLVAATAGGGIVVLDAVTADVVARVPPAPTSLNAVAFSPDGRLLVLGGDGGHVQVAEARSGRVTADLSAGGADVHAVAVTPDGHVLTGDAEGTVRVWDLATRTDRVVDRTADVVFDLAVDRTGTTAAVSGSDDVLLVDLTGGRAPRRLVGHSGYVTGVALSPDGTLVVSGGQDGTVRVWEVASGQQAAFFDLPGGDVSDVAVDHTGRRIAAVTDGGDGVVLDCAVCAPPEELATLAAQHSTRELTDDERGTFGLAG